VHFIGKLSTGTATEETVEHVVGRMGQCPVSINLKPIADTRIEVDFR
jgi:hypothetical protein